MYVWYSTIVYFWYTSFHRYIWKQILWWIISNMYHVANINALCDHWWQWSMNISFGYCDEDLFCTRMVYDTLSIGKYNNNDGSNLHIKQKIKVILYMIRGKALEPSIYSFTKCKNIIRKTSWLMCIDSDWYLWVDLLFCL
jgi:hypothetical protein